MNNLITELNQTTIIKVQSQDSCLLTRNKSEGIARHYQYKNKPNEHEKIKPEILYNIYNSEDKLRPLNTNLFEEGFNVIEKEEIINN